MKTWILITLGVVGITLTGAATVTTSTEVNALDEAFGVSQAVSVAAGDITTDSVTATNEGVATEGTIGIVDDSGTEVGSLTTKTTVDDINLDGISADANLTASVDNADAPSEV